MLLYFLFFSLRQLGRVTPALIAGNFSLKGMAQHIATLVIILGWSHLEHQVFRKFRARVSHMHSRDKYRLFALSSSQNTPAFRNSSGVSGSAEQGSHEAMFHAYSVKICVHPFLFVGALEHRFVKVRENILYI